MCLSNVYRESSDGDAKKRELLIKNAATVSVEGDKLVFTDIMGVRTVIDAGLEKIDLMENYILVR